MTTALISKVVLFADVAGSMELFAKRGIESATDLIGCSLETCKSAIVAEGGQVIKFLGDGVLAVFLEASSAARAALEIQKAHQFGDIRFKVGIDVGIVIEKDDDFFGDPVGLASRICDKAHAGEIFASAAVVEQTDDSIIKSNQSFLWLKGHPNPINIYKIEENEISASTATQFVSSRPSVPTTGLLRASSDGRTIPIGADRPSISIGREAGDLIVPRSSVSREHAVIKWSKGEGFTLHDTSKNGSYIRMKGGELRHIHRDRSPLTAACSISFGEESEQGPHDVHFEFSGA